MLMFETSIFSSFIPQLFMVVAYVSCILAPKFSSNEQLQFFETSADKQIVIHAPLLEKTDLPLVIDYLFSDFYVDDNSNLDVRIVHFVPLDVFVHRSQNFISKAFLQSCFSRPPPVFC